MKLIKSLNIVVLVGFLAVLSVLQGCTINQEKSDPPVTSLVTTSTSSESSIVTTTDKPKEKMLTPFLKTKVVDFKYNQNAPLNPMYQQTINPGKFVAEDETHIFYLKNGNVYSFDKLGMKSKLIYDSPSNVVGINVHEERIYFLDAVEQVYSVLSLKKDGTDLLVEVSPANNKLYFEDNYAYFSHNGLLAKYNLDSKQIEDAYATSHFEYLLKIENVFYYYNTYDFTLRSYDIEFKKEHTYDIRVSQYIKGFDGKIYFTMFDQQTKLHDIYYLDEQGLAVLFFKHQARFPIIDFIITDDYLYYVSCEFLGSGVFLYRFNLQTKETVIMNELYHANMIQLANGYFLSSGGPAFDVIDIDGNRVNIEL